MGSAIKMPTPSTRPTIVKKRVKRFKRHQSDLYVRVKDSWRRPKGIDSVVRRKFRVHNVAELELLMMHNTEYAAEVAHDVSLKTRTAINARADELDIKVVNRNARMTTEDDE